MVRYEHFVGTSSFLRIVLWMSMETMRINITQIGLCFGKIFFINVSEYANETIFKGTRNECITNDVTTCTNCVVGLILVYLFIYFTNFLPLKMFVTIHDYAIYILKPSSNRSLFKLIFLTKR